jgi:hypothetical protein
MYLNEFTNKTVERMLNARMDGESFRSVIGEAIKLTILECADRVQDYSNHRIPASEYSNLLRELTK